VLGEAMPEAAVVKGPQEIPVNLRAPAQFLPEPGTRTPLEIPAKPAPKADGAGR